MINIEKYLNSGIIENYCLGLTSPDESIQLEAYCRQFPEVKQVLESTQQLLETYLLSFNTAPSPDTRQKILDGLEDLKFETVRFNPQTGQIGEYIALSKNSDPKKWKNLIKDLKPPAGYDNIHTHKLYRGENERLFVLWVKSHIPDETHENINECFLILQGTCICEIENDQIDLGPGSFLQLPLKGRHNLKVTSHEPVVAILSRVNVA